MSDYLPVVQYSYVYRADVVEFGFLTRSGAGNSSNNNNNNNNGPANHPVNNNVVGNLPPPPVPTVEQMAATQAMHTQLLQGMAASVNALLQNAVNQNQNQNQNNPPPPPPRDRRAEFMRGRPPYFSHAPNPMDAIDWLKAVEKQLVIAQCTDREKVLYGSGQLQGSAQAWWEAYCFAQDDPEAITWAQFKA